MPNAIKTIPTRMVAGRPMYPATLMGAPHAMQNTPPGVINNPPAIIIQAQARLRTISVRNLMGKMLSVVTPDGTPGLYLEATSVVNFVHAFVFPVSSVNVPASVGAPAAMIAFQV